MYLFFHQNKDETSEAERVGEKYPSIVLFLLGLDKQS